MPPAILDIANQSSGLRQQCDPSSPAPATLVNISHQPETPNTYTQSEPTAQRLHNYSYASRIYYSHSLPENQSNPSLPTDRDELPGHQKPTPLILRDVVESFPLPVLGDPEHFRTDSVPRRKPDCAHLLPVYSSGTSRTYRSPIFRNLQNMQTIHGNVGIGDNEDDDDEFVVRAISELGLSGSSQFYISSFG